MWQQLLALDAASIREYANFMRGRMNIYQVDAALAAHLEERVPEHPVHALPGRFEMHFEHPPKTWTSKRCAGGPHREKRSSGVQTTCAQHHNALKSCATVYYGTHSVCNGAEMAVGPCSRRTEPNASAPKACKCGEPPPPTPEKSKHEQKAVDKKQHRSCCAGGRRSCRGAGHRRRQQQPSPCRSRPPQRPGREILGPSLMGRPHPVKLN